MKPMRRQDQILEGKRKAYQCTTHKMIAFDANGVYGLVQVIGCQLIFVTVGNPQTCPRCHAQLPVA